MVNGLKVPSRLETLNPSGTRERRSRGSVDWPSNGVGGLKISETIRRARGATQAQGLWSRPARKADGGVSRCPYRKPTQVGEASSLR